MPTRPKLRLTTITAIAVAALLGTATLPASADERPFVQEAYDYAYRIEADGVSYRHNGWTFKVHAPYFDAEHRAGGGGTGVLGYPRQPQVNESGNYWFQLFERGAIYASDHGTFSVKGPWTGGWGFARDSIAGQHQFRGGGSSFGYPTANEVEEAPGYFYQTFERGVVYAHSSWGSMNFATVSGDFVEAHRALGGGVGPLGYPLSDQVQSGGIWQQFFERGIITIENGVAEYSWGPHEDY